VPINLKQPIDDRTTSVTTALTLKSRFAANVRNQSVRRIRITGNNDSGPIGTSIRLTDLKP